MPNNPPDEGNTVALQTGDRPKALKPTLESMTLLVAAVIVHDKTTNRLVLLQRSENAKFALGQWDIPVGKNEPGEPITETAVRDLYEETGLTVKPECLKVAHIIHGAWGVEAPTTSSRSSSPPTTGPATPRTASPASTPGSAGWMPMPSPMPSWTPLRAPSTPTWPAAPGITGWLELSDPCLPSESLHQARSRSPRPALLEDRHIPKFTYALEVSTPFPGTNTPSPEWANLAIPNQPTGDLN